MIRFLLNIIRVIISAYLCALVILVAYYLVYTKLYNDKFPFVFEHSYIKLDNDYLGPKYEKNDYIFVKKYTEEQIKEGDYVVYLEDGKNIRLKQVTKVNDYMITLNYTKHNEENTIDVNDVIAKDVYSNDTLSTVLHIVTNPVVIIILFMCVVLLPELTYRRY